VDKRLIARINYWTATEAKAVLAAAVTAGAQTGAFFTLALDSGARKSELLGLQWSDLDLDAGTVTISKQLDDDDPVTFGVTKTKRARTITLRADTIARVRAHRKAQRELMMANRTTYVDHQLVFAKEPADQQAPTAALGTPWAKAHLSIRSKRRSLSTCGVGIPQPLHSNARIRPKSICH